MNQVEILMHRNITNMIKILNNCKQLYSLNRQVSISCALRYCEKKEEIKKHKHKIRETVELVTLVDQNDKILGLKPKTESEKLAKKLNLSLERVTDTKYGKIYPAYKMVSSSELLKAEIKTTTAKKLKKLTVSSRITDHDLKVKLQIVRNWIAKSCEVHVAISGDSGNITIMKNILKRIQEELKEEIRIIDIRQKENAMKFIILPPK